jgi:DNA polymerase III subunit epsilon
MLDWFKNINKSYPEFWKKYLSKFEEKSNRFVIISTETSGSNPDKDFIISLAAIAIVDNKIIVSDSIELPQKYNQENQISNTKIDTQTINKESIEILIDFIGNATLVGHRIHFDIEMIDQTLHKMQCGKLKNEALDIEVMYNRLHDLNDKHYTLDNLCKIHKVSKSEHHSSSDDAYYIAILFLKLKSKLNFE